MTILNNEYEADDSIHKELANTRIRKISQSLYLSSLHFDINSKKVTFHLSWYLGADTNKENRIVFNVNFRDENRNLVDTIFLEGINNTPSIRENELALAHLEKKRHKPLWTNSVLLELHAIRSSVDGIEAFADNLSFTLSKN